MGAQQRAVLGRLSQRSENWNGATNAWKENPMDSGNSSRVTLITPMSQNPRRIQLPRVIGLIAKVVNSLLL